MKKRLLVFVACITVSSLLLFSLAGCWVRSNVSVSHIVEKAKFETYTFSTRPAWAAQPQIADSGFFGKRFFIITCHAVDNRHIVLVQSKIYNKTLPRKIKGGGTLVYTSSNGFKVWGMPPEREKWFAGTLLKSAHAYINAAPSDDRIGYVLESPTGTFPALAVNGRLSNEELHSLIDSLVPAKEL